jgi:hypothetical protein
VALVVFYKELVYTASVAVEAATPVVANPAVATPAVAIRPPQG